MKSQIAKLYKYISLKIAKRKFESLKGFAKDMYKGNGKKYLEIERNSWS